MVTSGKVQRRAVQPAGYLRLVQVEGNHPWKNRPVLEARPTEASIRRLLWANMGVLRPRQHIPRVLTTNAENMLQMLEISLINKPLGLEVQNMNSTACEAHDSLVVHEDALPKSVLKSH